LVEHNLAKVGVGSSSLLSRSRFKKALINIRAFLLLNFYKFNFLHPINFYCIFSKKIHPLMSPA
jgi:hypothetical protein